MNKKINLTALLFGMVIIEACMVLPGAGGNTRPPSLAASPSGTITLPATRKPAATPTQTALPEEFRANLMQTYQMMVMIQFNAEAVAGTAGLVIEGKILPSEVLQSLHAVSQLTDAADWAIPFFFPPDRLQSHWKAALKVHVHTRELLGRWANGNIDALQAHDEIQGDLASINQAVGEVEGILVEEYGIDMQSLTQAREETLTGIRGTLATTATP